ncbi:MAG: glycosyl transferase, partial [Gammaproteobacteria bacterium]
WCLALLLAAGLSAIGFVDDRRSLPVASRLAAQLLAAGLLLAALWPELGATEQAAILAPACLLWLVGFSNLFNFMDGIDGFAASQAVFAGGAAAALALSNGAPGSTVLFLASLAAAVLGFLPWNWSPARLFMGDAGSLLLGFLFAAVGVLCVLHADLPWEVWAILWAPFLTDGLLTLFGRALRGEVLTSAHREHAYQRYALHRGSHRPVTLTLLALDIGWLLPLAALALRLPEYSILILLLAAAPVLLIFFRSPAAPRPV